MRMIPLRNEEALADPVYNPDIDSQIVQLYNMMAPTVDNPDPPELIAEYEELFLALPTANIFSAVLVNPRQCEIVEIRDGITEIGVLLPIIRAQLPVGDRPAWDSNPLLTVINNQLLQIEDDLAAIETHTSRLTTNLPSLIGIAQSSLGLATIIAALANPCAGLENFIGSLMAKGKVLFDSIASILNPILTTMRAWASGAITAIGDMLGPIADAIADIAEKTAEFMEIVASEIAAFVQSMIGQVRMGLAEFLNSIKADPCLRSLAGALLTGSAAAVLG